MRNRVGIKKMLAFFSVATLLTATVILMGNTVTAWAFPNEGTITTDNVNVRQSAVDGTVIDSLNSGASVTVTGSTEGSDGQTWYQVEYTSSGGSGVTGWVREDFINVIEDTTPEETVVEEVVEEEPDLSQVNLVVSSGIPSEMIPVGFQLTTVEYEGTEISALVMNNADVYLLYMEDTEGIIDGRLVVYDMDKAELIPYISFETDNGFILLLNIPDEEAATVSDRFVATLCEFTDGSMDALQMTIADTAIDETINLSDYYFMYGVNRDGEYGWYVYNATEGNIQESILNVHYNLNGTLVEAAEEEPASFLDSLSLIAVIVILAVLVLLVILVIVFGVRYRRLKQEFRAKTRADKKHGKEGKQEPKSKSRKRNREDEDEEEDAFADFDPVYYRPASGTQSVQQTPPPMQQTPPPMQQTPPPMQQTPPPMQQPSQPSPQPTTENNLDDDDLEFL